MMTSVAVELRNVVKHFDDVVAVDDISMKIFENEFFSLLGPSGCGKTTTLRMIGGFEYPTSGDIYISGRSVVNIPPNKRETNLIFQSLALFPHLDIYDNIAFGLRMKRLSRSVIKEKVTKVLDLVDLSSYESRKISQISGGQQQRVAIARAMVNDPKVLLLDEPLGALDLKLRLQMQEELKDLQHRLGTTFIYVTHDQGEALTMSDRIAVMRRGIIEQVGSGREIYERPATRFVASFIGDSNLIEGNVSEVHDDHCMVDCDGLVVKVNKYKSAIRDKQVILSIRPERIKFITDQGDFENVYPSEIVKVTYKGSIINYEVKLPFNKLISIQTQIEGEEIHQSGETVQAGWKADSCVILEVQQEV